MKLPEWYKDLTKAQQKRADKLLKKQAKDAENAQVTKDGLQKLRRIAATNRTRKQQAAKRSEGE